MAHSDDRSGLERAARDGSPEASSVRQAAYSRVAAQRAARVAVAAERQAAMASLNDALVMLMGADRRRRDRVTRSEDLSHTHLRALFLLLRQGEATAGALARAADLNPASVTAMIDQLQHRGLVERRRHAADRRVCLVTLTDSGESLVTAEERRTATRLHGLLEGISDEELRAATRVLDRLTALMDDALMDDAGPRGRPRPGSRRAACETGEGDW
jgi:DNA-binding MarR family transcriptional regulator